MEDVVNDDRFPVPLSLGGRHLCTEELYQFLRRHHMIFDFFMFSLKLSDSADKARYVALEALAKHGSEDDKEEFERVKQDPDTVFNQLVKFANLQSENMNIRAADNFVCYISETIQRCMLKKPEMLKSSESVRTEVILRFKTRKDLVSYLVDRKLNDLTYGGLREIEKFLDDRIGVTLTTSESERALLLVAIELRNIYTHNRGVVNEIFLSRLAGVDHGHDFKKGKRFHADYDTTVTLANNLASIAERVDREVAQKFGLKAKRYSTWYEQRKAAKRTST